MIAECTTLTVITLILSVTYANTRPPAPPAPQQEKAVHDCTIHGHAYETIYDDVKAPTIKDIQEVIKENNRNLRPIDKHELSAIINSTRTRRYLQSVCRYCGLKVERSEGS